MIKINPNDICAIFISYNPSESFVENVQCMAQQVSKVFVVDNGSHEKGRKIVIKSMERHNAQLLSLERNIGIAAALNAGIEQASNHGFNWVLTMDHDSRPDKKMVQMLIETLYSANSRSIGIVGPTLIDIDKKTNLQKEHCRSNKESNLFNTLMTSGCLTNVDCWKEVGKFREDMFIDYVDHEYCLRCLSREWKIIQSSAVLFHKLGEMRTHKLLEIIPYNVSHHSPGRRYYMTRNRIILWSLYKLKYPRWVANDIKKFLVEFAKITISEKNKIKKFLAVGLGILDAVTGKMGKHNYRFLEK